MELDECRRTLMVGPGATAQEIRQAYLDQVRVWHPDRFQSDERLRHVAEERLREINQAYTLLRRGKGADESRPEPDTPPPASAPSSPIADEPPAYGTWAFRRNARYRLPDMRPAAKKLLYGCATVALCLCPLATAAWWAQSWRIPILGVESPSIASLTLSLRDLSPAGIADGLPAGTSEPDSQTSHRRTLHIRRSKPTISSPAPLENGAELLSGSPSSGAGKIHVVNETDSELIVRLIRAKEVVREMYIAPRSAASLTHIAIGVYYVQAEKGSEYDMVKRKFRGDSAPSKPLGPFKFLEFSNASGTTGQYYELILHREGERS